MEPTLGKKTAGANARKKKHLRHADVKLFGFSWRSLSLNHCSATGAGGEGRSILSRDDVLLKAGFRGVGMKD